MLPIKKITVAILTATSSVVFAGAMGAACTGMSTAPCASSAWDLGGQALYLQPRYSGVNFLGTISNTQIATAPGSLNYQSANDRWGWGFKLDASYHFYTGNDFNINWSHYAISTNGTIDIPVGSSFSDNIQNDYSLGPIYTNRKPTWDAANFEFGQHVKFGDRDNVRFHGGIQYARINTRTSFASPNSTNSTTSSYETMTYNGFGPRVGLDMLYSWKNFGVYATGATAILVGPSQFNDTGVGSTNGTTWHYVTGSTTAIVPEVEAKLGVNYIYSMAQGDLKLDVGWMWNNYFNSQQNIVGQGQIQQSDFGLQGLYFGLNWLSNFA